jgi:aminoglycoside phosphotransferase (APT) family kinase protein
MDAELAAFAADKGLIREGEEPTWTALTGGVSSDVWKLEVGGRSYCLKRAIPKLRVKADWRAPVRRTLYEWRWFETARSIIPDSAPEPVALDAERSMLAMVFLEQHPLWKQELLAGRVQIGFAGRVGAALVRIHAATAGRADIAARFDTDELFMALRLDAYLLATAEQRPEVAGPLRALVVRTAATKLALVHGDVSPKNILMGPSGPVFLDAETAWYGDPAFDLAFCLNHLILKHLVVAGRTEALFASFDVLKTNYLAGVDWEPAADLEARAASLLPGLMLARVDGKSPVEYLADAAPKAVVRRAATALLNDPPTELETVRAAWAEAIRR